MSLEAIWSGIVNDNEFVYIEVESVDSPVAETCHVGWQRRVGEACA